MRVRHPSKVLFRKSSCNGIPTKKIARREDLTPSLAMGVSLAHVTAIVVPVFGAALWDQLGYRFPFLFGTIFVILSLVFTQKIDVAKQRIGNWGTAEPAGAD